MPLKEESGSRPHARNAQKEIAPMRIPETLPALVAQLLIGQGI